MLIYKVVKALRNNLIRWSAHKVSLMMARLLGLLLFLMIPAFRLLTFPSKMCEMISVSLARNLFDVFAIRRLCVSLLDITIETKYYLVQFIPLKLCFLCVGLLKSNFNSKKN